MGRIENRSRLHVLSQRCARALTALLIAAAFTAPLLAEVPPRTNDPITVENVLELINAWRDHYGLDPLEEDKRLSLAAEDRIIDMEERLYWGHNHPTEGGSPFVWLRKRGYISRAAGENLSAGYETAWMMVLGWMNSPGHRDNILSPEFEHIGVAWIDGGTTQRMEGRSVVALFASER